jgi:hypothetical protein
MSSFGFLNVSGIDGTGNGSGGGSVFPGGIDKSVQFNDGGLAFGGVSNFLYDKVNNLLTVPKIKPTQILDGINLTGTAGQVLSSTGSGLQYVNAASPGAPNTSVQFNQGGVFTGDSNFVFDSTNDVLNVNGNVGIGSLSAPTDRLVVTGANSTIRVKSTTVNNANLVLEDSSVGVKQLQMFVNTDSADFVSIQQGSGFRNFRFNTGASTSCISVGTTGAQAIGGIMCSNAFSNRKIILFSAANDEHQNLSLGVNTDTFRFQVPNTSTRYAWFAGTSSSTSVELMSLSGAGNLIVGGQGTTNLSVTKSALGNAAPTTVPTGTYLKLGGTEFRSGTSNPNYRLIGFGFNTGTNNQPAYMGYIETNGSIQSNGALVFGTRPSHTVDAIPSERMRISPAGNVSIGNTNDTFPLEVTGTIRSTSSRPDTILDTSNAAGTAGQVLSSTGSAIQWVNPPVGTVPGGANTNIQFNSSGSFGGSNNFTYTDTTSHLKVQGLLTVGNLFTTVPRIFAQSGSALFAVSSWDDQWILAGGGSGAANSAGIGMGYNNSITSGVIACCEPSTGYKPIIYSAASHDFKTNGSTRMTVTQTGGGDGLLTVPILQAGDIRDGFLNTGTNGQVLSSTGIGLLWKSPAPYCVISNGAAPAGGFSAGIGIPPIGTVANAIFGAFPRTSSYRISTSVSGYSGGAGTVNNMQIWYRTTSGNPWVLSHTHQLYFNNALFHLSYPTKSNIISITAGNPLQILVRALTPNTASDNNDFFNIEILECTI